ncbi:MAG: hypothetical protein ABI681_02775, partial [Gemmatimonadales bacterium]
SVTYVAGHFCYLSPRLLSAANSKVLLLADGIGFHHPGAELVINILGISESKGMQMIPRRESLDATKTRGFQATSQDDMPIEPALAWRDLRKRHADLEGDASLLGEDAHRADRLNHLNDPIEETANRGRFATEVVGKVICAARVGLIAVRELPAT